MGDFSMVADGLHYKNQSTEIKTISQESNESVQQSSLSHSIAKNPSRTQPFSLSSEHSSHLLVGQQGIPRRQYSDTLYVLLSTLENIYREIATIAKRVAYNTLNSEERDMCNAEAHALLIYSHSLLNSVTYKNTPMLSERVDTHLVSKIQNMSKIHILHNQTMSISIYDIIHTLKKNEGIDVSTASHALSTLIQVNSLLIAIDNYKKVIESESTRETSTPDDNESLHHYWSVIEAHSDSDDMPKEKGELVRYCAKHQASQYMYVLSLHNIEKLAHMILSK